MKKYKIILAFSLLLNIILIGFGGVIVIKRGGISFLNQQVKAVTTKEEFTDYHRQKLSIYQSSSIKNVDVAFVGDSITDHGEWNELFPDLIVINRGVSGDTTNGVLDRLDEIIDKKPKTIFILIGINDLFAGESNDSILYRYEKILVKIKRKLPDTKVYVQSVLPINSELIKSTTNMKIKDLNKEIESLAIKNNVQYIDLFNAFLKDNELNKRYTIDGVHLTGFGFDVWKKQLIKYISNATLEKITS